MARLSYLPTLSLLLLLVLAPSLALAQIPCTGTRTFTVSLTYNWTASNDPQYPEPAHFSPLICALSSDKTLFVRGAKATPGFVTIAQTGMTPTLRSELTANPAVVDHQEAPGTAIGTGTGSTAPLSFVAKPGSSFLGCVSMIAPSPDWVVGFRDMDLCDTATGMWKGDAGGMLAPYTAGSDSGETYMAPDAPAEGVIGTQSVNVIPSYGEWAIAAAKEDASPNAATTTAAQTESPTAAQTEAPTTAKAAPTADCLAEGSRCGQEFMRRKGDCCLGTTCEQYRRGYRMAMKCVLDTVAPTQAPSVAPTTVYVSPTEAMTEEDAEKVEEKKEEMAEKVVDVLEEEGVTEAPGKGKSPATQKLDTASIVQCLSTCLF